MRRLTNRMLAPLFVLALVLMAAPAWAGSILIINGSSGTSESDTTSSITTNLQGLMIAAGNTVTISDLVPGSFAGYGQVWDIRFSNNLALTASDQTQYLAFLQGGGGMFVMGENASFTTRNNSVLALIAAAGGGSLAFTTPASTETVVPPFTLPNPVATVTFAAPGGVTSPGTGQYITTDGVNGAGVAFGIGQLSAAPAGALTVIFDVNFMQNLYDVPNSQNLTKNLIGFVQQQVDPEVPVVPEPATLLLLGSGLVGIVARKRRSS